MSIGGYIAIEVARWIRKIAEWLEFAVAGSDTYPHPECGWTCFHCGETFHTQGAARRHFGGRADERPRCALLLERLTEARAELKKLSSLSPSCRAESGSKS